jgi:hypothetical protein
VFLQLAIAFMFFQGMAVVGVKQLSRNNLNEETVETIKVCEDTEAEIVKMFRKPTEDFMRTQGEYTIYIYKGFSGRGGLEKQTLEIMLNTSGIVVDKRFNQESEDLMIDRCVQ